MRKGLKGGEGEGALQKFATCMQYDGITSNLGEIERYNFEMIFLNSTESLLQQSL